MAALYLHNALFSPDTETRPTHYIRNLPSVSTGTLRSSSSGYSHPTEPLLLESATSESLAYQDLLLRQPAHPDGLGSNQAVRLSFEGDEPTAEEKKAHRVKKMKRQLRWLKGVKGTLEVLFGAWAIYNIVAYLLAFTKYTSKGGQTASLALGISATLSLALLMASALIPLFRPYLLLHDIPIQLLLNLRAVLQYLSLLFLLAPALVNFALTIAWKNSVENELRLRDRCTVSIDAVWTPPGPNCPFSKPQPWVTWITLSIIRVVLTILTLGIYHAVSEAYHNVRRPSARFRSHRRVPTARMKMSSATASDTHVVSLPLSVYSSGQVSELLPKSTDGHDGLLTPRCPDEEFGQTIVDTQATAEDDPAHEMQQSLDNELPGFIDRFKSLVSQITQDTNDALDLAWPGYSSVLSSDASDDAFDPYLGYPLPVTPVRATPDRVHVLGGVIHRMPTIESMGSHEMTSCNSSLHGVRDSATVGSDPSVEGSSPTRSNARSNTLSTLSQSRRNSYEVGDLLTGTIVGVGGGVPLGDRGSTSSSYYTSPTRESGEAPQPLGL